ncbi:DMT family transporter [Halodesulfovibrio marinisediminis]|uniref:Transporter family-2 protein n=1 Tax=Halodesulfovibrio marinisediminis DSM 17456 TaxID=1121457 RepID=A0A1N6J548_9BACT|nr:DMT family transporter [Halodesulfovibrio marinisediminis]SIO39391.1 transporter family-2 protein [Halodesulfovibrio marinisediminis DSM 17456]
MHTALLFLALCVGTFMPLQMGLNAMVNLHWSHSAPIASLISFFVGTIALSLFVYMSKTPIPPFATSTVPWYAWFAGLLGAVGVTTLTFLAPRLGALAMVSLIICGQLIGSVVFDHFGLVGYTIRPVTLMRILGIVLLIAGAYLVNRY